MTKISDITKWLIRGRGDEGQVRSIIKLCRADGLFSSSGRGRGSLEMTPADFASALACALVTGMTTHAPKQVREVLDLKIWSIAIDPSDGWKRDLLVSDYYDQLHGTDDWGNPCLPPELPRVPATVGDALEMWAAHFMNNPATGVMDWDKLTLRVTAELRVELFLHNPAWNNRGWDTEEGDYQGYAWRLRFEADDVHYDALRRETVTTLSAYTLKPLAELAGGND